jgi:Rieske Fe-S protein
MNQDRSSIVRTVMSQTSPDPALDPATSAPTGADGVSRRTVLRVAAVSGAGAALLAACGGDDSAADPATTPGPTGEAPPDTEGTDEATDGNDGTGDTGGGGALVATADVPVGSGVILEEQKVVVTQLTEGEFAAFTAVCTHSQCTVTGITAKRISCPCHGSAFSPEDGSVLNGPARSPLRSIPVTVEGDEVVRA